MLLRPTLVDPVAVVPEVAVVAAAAAVVVEAVRNRVPLAPLATTVVKLEAAEVTEGPAISVIETWAAK